MHIVKEFVDFRYSLLCGFPSITLRGTRDDWVKLRDVVVPQLADFGLDWYEPRASVFVDAHIDKNYLLCPRYLDRKVPLLQHILSRIIEAYDGKKNVLFWEALYGHRFWERPGQYSGVERVYESKGWLFAFLCTEQKW